MDTVTQTMRCRQALTDGVNEYGEKWLIVKCPLGAKVKLPAQPGGSFGCHNKTLERIASGSVEQVRGIEPPCSAWEADILPLNYTCIALI